MSKKSKKEAKRISRIPSGGREIKIINNSKNDLNREIKITADITYVPKENKDEYDSKDYNGFCFTVYLNGGQIASEVIPMASIDSAVESVNFFVKKAAKAGIAGRETVKMSKAEKKRDKAEVVKEIRKQNKRVKKAHLKEEEELEYMRKKEKKKEEKEAKNIEKHIKKIKMTVDVDMAYLYLEPKADEPNSVAKTIPVQANLDLDKNGKVIGIEVFDWPRDTK
jgi:uncharacterized protein YuzE